MHCHCCINSRAPRLTFTDPCKPEVWPGAREESASPAWLAAPAMNARDTTKVYIWRLNTGCWPTLYRKCHSHNTPGKRHNNTWVEPFAGNCTTSSYGKGNRSDKNVKYRITDALRQKAKSGTVFRYKSHYLSPEGTSKVKQGFLI